MCVISGAALFWVVTQRVMVISYRRFGTTYRSNLKGSRYLQGPRFLTDVSGQLIGPIVKDQDIFKAQDFLTTFRDILSVPSSRARHIQGPRFLNDVSGQLIGPIVKGQDIFKDQDFLTTFRDNIGPIVKGQHIFKGEDFFPTFRNKLSVPSSRSRYLQGPRLLTDV